MAYLGLSLLSFVLKSENLNSGGEIQNIMLLCITLDGNINGMNGLLEILNVQPELKNEIHTQTYHLTELQVIVTMQTLVHVVS